MNCKKKKEKKDIYKIPVKIVYNLIFQGLHDIDTPFDYVSTE